MSASDEPLDGDGGGGSSFIGLSVDLSRYLGVTTGNNGLPKIKFRLFALIAVLGKAATLAAFEGFTRLVQGVFGAARVPFVFVRDAVRDVLLALFGVSGVIDAGFTAAQAQLVGTGVAAFALAVAAFGAASIVFSTGVKLFG